MGKHRTLLSRWRQMTIWNRLGVGSSVATILGLLLSLLFFFWPQSPSAQQRSSIDHSFGGTVLQSGRDIILGAAPNEAEDEFSLTGSLSVEEFVVAEHDAVLDREKPGRVVALHVTVVNTGVHEIYPAGVLTTIVGKCPSTGENVCLTFDAPKGDTSSALKSGEPRTYHFFLPRAAEIAALYNRDASCLTTFASSRGDRNSIYWPQLAKEFVGYEPASRVVDENVSAIEVDVLVNAGIMKELGWLDESTATVDFDLLVVQSSLVPKTRLTSVVDTEEEARELLRRGLNY